MDSILNMTNQTELAVATVPEGGLTIEQFVKVLPAQMKKSVNQELVNQVNLAMADPLMREQYRDNILGYVSVLMDGKFKITNYLDAVRYCGFKIMGDSNINAYVKTFPDRYQTFLANGTSEKDIASYVTSYNKNKLVNLIMAQSLVPSHVLNADIHQDAINTLAKLMQNANSEKVRCDAANNLLTHLKPPETKKIELDVGVKQDKSINELKEVMLALGKQQRDMVQGGMMTAKDLAHSKVITAEAEVIDVE